MWQIIQARWRSAGADVATIFLEAQGKAAGNHRLVAFLILHWMASKPNWMALAVFEYVCFYQFALFRFVPNSNGLHSTELPQTC